MKKFLVLVILFFSTLCFAQQKGLMILEDQKYPVVVREDGKIFFNLDGKEYEVIIKKWIGKDRAHLRVDGKDYRIDSDGGVKAYRSFAKICDKKRLEEILVKRMYDDDDNLVLIVDKNAPLRKDGSTGYNIAASTNIKKCRETARWLSDIGVKDAFTGGGAHTFIGTAPPKKPYVFEDARVKITFTFINKYGDIIGTLYNKTDDDIQYVGQIYTLNGKTNNEYIKDAKKFYKPKQSAEFWLSAFNFDEIDSQEGPKVVKNKITFKKEDAVFIYRYKGKEYKMNLKVGGVETHDVYYVQDSVEREDEAIRKEQLGY